MFRERVKKRIRDGRLDQMSGYVMQMFKSLNQGAEKQNGGCACMSPVARCRGEELSYATALSARVSERVGMC